jgi:predicted SprT family Zn-dependent metalloprotease
MFHKQLDIEIILNKRLKTTLGAFVFFEENTPRHIEVSTYLCQQSEYVIADTLAHELTHYYLYSLHRDFNDTSNEFKTLLMKFGISPSKSSYFVDNNLLYEYYQYIYQCECGQTIEFYEQANTCIPINYNKYIICPNCKSKMMIKEKEMICMEYTPSPFVEKITNDFLK